MPIWTTTHLPLNPDHLPWRGRWPGADTAIPQAREEAGRLLAPQVIYQVVPVKERTPAGSLLEGGLLLHSLDLLAALGPAGHLALAVYTIGPALEARSRACSERGEITESFLLDALGTVALDGTGPCPAAAPRRGAGSARPLPGGTFVPRPARLASPGPAGALCLPAARTHRCPPERAGYDGAAQVGLLRHPHRPRGRAPRGAAHLRALSPPLPLPLQ